MAASPDEILAMVFFARVVEEQSFTRAAAKLGVSKSVVSTRIAALEHQLQVPLLHRTTRQLSLTPEGRALFERCARVVAAADEASLAAASTGNVPRGLLRVNAPVAFGQEYLAEPMATYLERHREVRLQLSLEDKMVDLVQEGVDVALRISPGLADASLVAKKLGVDRTVLCAAPSYLERRGVPRSPDELLHHDCLIYSLLRVRDEWRFREGRGAPYSPPLEGRFSAASGAMLRRAALAGMGLAVLPIFMVARDLASGALLPVLEEQFVAVELGIYAVYPQSKRPPSKVRAFIEVLSAHFGQPRWPG